MKLILFAHQNWGVVAIKELINSNHEILYVFTHPFDMDKHEKVWYKSVTEQCNKLKIPVEEKTSVTDNDSYKINELKPDLILSIGWRRLLPSSIFKIPKFGTVNLHDSLIPNYRGFAPINWAIINGEKEVGITTHFIDEGIDTGNIILQKKLSISFTDTAFDVFNNLLELSPKLVLDTIDMIEKGQVTHQKNNNANKGFFCSRRFPDDGKISWQANRESIYNLIRALCDPYPNAFCFYEGKKIFIKRAQLTNEDYRGMPGKICAILDEGIVVTCGSVHTKNQGLLITEIGIDKKSYKPNEYFFKLWKIFE